MKGKTYVLTIIDLVKEEKYRINNTAVNIQFSHCELSIENNHSQYLKFI